MSRLKTSPSQASLPGTRVRSNAPWGRRWLFTRLCPGCGYAGDELQHYGDAAVYMCPCCAADLYARPPRSYAEREGLIEIADPAVTRAAARAAARAHAPSVLRLSRIPRGRRVWRWVSSALARLL